MALVFNIILHGLLIGSMGCFIFFVIAGAITEPDARERGLRILALAAGALVAVGAQVVGISYASFIVNALANGRSGGAAAAVVASVAPGVGGIGLGWFLVRTYRRSTRLGTRVLGFIGMLSTLAFVAIYAQATQTKGVVLGAAAIPNVSFVVGVILTIMFKFDADVREGDPLGTQIRVLLGGGRGESSVTIGSRVAPPATRPRRDPFSDSK
jgi:hypothetical protein